MKVNVFNQINVRKSERNYIIMTEQLQILEDPKYIPVHEFGFVGLVEVMGDDSTPPNRARISYGKGTKSVSDDRNLLRYLIRNKHTTPVEMIELVFHLKMPIFVMRQHVRHRMSSMNEYSARYSEMSDEFYTPIFEDIALQSKTNKQGRSLEEEDAFEFNEKMDIQTLMNSAYSKSYETYRALLDKGLARELARSVLPVSNYTECFWKIDLHNFFHFCKLRRDPHAQKEIRDFADAMFQLVEFKLPLCCEAFNDYLFEAKTFSRMEMVILKAIISEGKWKGLLGAEGENFNETFGLTKREFDEFIAKLGLNNIA